MKPIPLPMAELKPALTGLSKIIHRRSTLPILGAVKIERTTEGWITLTGTDLDHYSTVRLEQPSAGEAATILIPHEELVKVTKSCGKNDTIAVRSEKEASETSGIITYPIGGQEVEHRCQSFDAQEFPPIPGIQGHSVALPDPIRTSLLEAFECASTDETRFTLNGAYLDVSQQSGHYIVATDGRQLFSSNSFKLDLPRSLIIPSHKFIGWKEFRQDGEWQLTVGDQQKDQPTRIQISSRRWTFLSKAVEGNYPNWRQVIPDAKKYKTTVEFGNVENTLQTVHRLPCHDEVNHTIAIELKNQKVNLLGKSPGAESWTKVEIEAQASGPDILTALNREYLTRALEFGLTTLQIIDQMAAMRFSADGRQMIVMPIRADAGPKHQQTVPESTAQVADQTVNSKPAADEAAQPQRTEAMPRITTPAVETNGTNGNGHTEPTPTLHAALEQIEKVKGSYREAIQGLNGLTDTLKAVQRGQKANEKEVQSVRSALEKLQSVRL